MLANPMSGSFPWQSPRETTKTDMPTTKHKMPRRGCLFAIASVCVILAGVYGYYRYNYPYGFSHCCDIALMGALQEYADEHEGAFPTGETTPEASLSLLYNQGRGLDPNTLRGKTVPEKTVRTILERGGLLGPKTCGWHYTDGLRMDDDPRLALIWDKPGLGHNGKRLTRGSHHVLMLNWERKFIPGTEWEQFLQEQTRLLAARTNGTQIAVMSTTTNAGEEVRVQLRVVENYLMARIWRAGAYSGRYIAHIDREPDTGVVGLPILSAAEVKTLTTELDPEAGNLRFMTDKHQIDFTGSEFDIQERPN